MGELIKIFCKAGKKRVLFGKPEWVVIEELKMVLLGICKGYPLQLIFCSDEEGILEETEKGLFGGTERCLFGGAEKIRFGGAERVFFEGLKSVFGELKTAFFGEWKGYFLGYKKEMVYFCGAKKDLF